MDTVPSLPRPARPLDVSIVVPTFNEAGNVPELLARLRAVMGGLEWEVVFVDDDSPDGTASIVRKAAVVDPRVRVVQRVGRRGLSSACIEGMLASAAPVIAVMDGDLQHDESLLPRMVAELRRHEADVVIGSRYVSGGGVGAWDESRHRMSALATRLARRVLPEEVADPMSGFFVVRREVVDARVRKLSGLGFKILLDLLTADRRPLKVIEVPYQFRTRAHGESKLDATVVWDFLMLVGDRLFGRFVPVRFVAFAAVGGAGVFVHFAVLTLLLKGFGERFALAQAGATLVAMVFNYSINNLLTFRDQRRTGSRWWTGLASFVAVCGVGAAANVGVASYLFARDARWVLAALAGVVVGAVWNYAVTSAYTWRNSETTRPGVR